MFHLSEEICEYTTQADYDSLVSEPSITESDVKFKEDPDTFKALNEFGL